MYCSYNEKTHQEHGQVAVDRRWRLAHEDSIHWWHCQPHTSRDTQTCRSPRGVRCRHSTTTRHYGHAPLRRHLTLLRQTGNQSAELLPTWTATLSAWRTQRSKQGWICQILLGEGAEFWVEVTVVWILRLQAQNIVTHDTEFEGMESTYKQLNSSQEL